MFLMLPDSPTASPIVPLTEGRFQLGRSAECRFFVNDASVSRQHAEIFVSGDQVTITDLASRNGTFIEGKQITQNQLGVGQHVRFGDVGFVLIRTEKEREQATAEGSTAVCDKKQSMAAADRAKQRLSPAQVRVLGHLLEGSDEKEIAERLRLSQHTVHNHIRAVYRAIGVHSRTELLAALWRGRPELPAPGAIVAAPGESS